MTQQISASSHASSHRMLALDVMRGITVAGMILVNNPGSWEHIYAPLRHAEWHGLTPTDLVFPFFMFIMGLSMAFSLRRTGYGMTPRLGVKIVRRSVVIFALGLLLDRIAAFAWGAAGAEGPGWLAEGMRAAFDASDIRIPGVLQRLAVCYLFASLIALSVGRRTVKWIVGVFLAAYSAILLAAHGLDFSPENIVGAVDRALMGENHIYHEHAFGTSLALDPEGLLSTIPSIAHTLIGYLAGRMLLDTRPNAARALNLLLAGTALCALGALLSYGMPVNKKIWSPTFVLATCGMAMLLLGVLVWWIDIKGHRRWCRPFEVFGINPLALYVASGVLATLLGVTAGSAPYDRMARVMGSECAASLTCALLFVALNWLIGLPLYRRRIIIKI